LYRAENVGSETLESAARYAQGGNSGADDFIEEGRDRISDGIEQVRQSLQSGWEQTRESLEHTRERAMQATSGFWDTLDEHPLAVGLMGLAIGAAIGASLPTSRTEGKWLGDVGQNVVDSGRNLGRETLSKVKDTVRNAAETGMKAAEKTASR
jgi:ElaB/YqjD/DUF883 family membrane-anchored ribosome-binding protein